MCELHVVSCCLDTITAGALAGIMHLTKLNFDFGSYANNYPMRLESDVLADVAGSLQCLRLCNVDCVPREPSDGDASMCLLAPRAPS